MSDGYRKVQSDNVEPLEEEVEVHVQRRSGRKNNGTITPAQAAGTLGVAGVGLLILAIAVIILLFSSEGTTWMTVGFLLIPVGAVVVILGLVAYAVLAFPNPLREKLLGKK
mmetsp:Transcript_64097/g.89080  ORF Transcript_64097/g.89080 Transcript_64097/m.89080 type:complete len:111 (-) Transcript_64097:176-508(-)